MPADTTTKLCAICGTDVSGSKRVKDTAGRYYCQPCWDTATRAGSAGSTLPPSEPQRAERNPAPLVILLSTIGVVIVLTVSWLLFYRPSWQEQHKAQVVVMLTEAKSLVTAGRTDDAYRKYSEVFKFLGSNAITDDQLQAQLAEAKASMVKLESVAGGSPSGHDRLPAPSLSVAGPSNPSPPAAPTDQSHTFLGDQLASFKVSGSGEISSDSERTLYLLGTEDKAFVVSGEVWLTSGSSQFDAGGVLFHLRDQDGMHRYELSAGGLRAKRVLLEGRMVEKFAYPIHFSNVPRDQWVPFRIEIRKAGMVVVFGEERGEVQGPLSTKGKNGIDLSAGGKLRNVNVSLVRPPVVAEPQHKTEGAITTPQRQPATTPVQVSATSTPAQAARVNSGQATAAQQLYSEGTRLCTGGDGSPPDQAGAFQALKKAADLGHIGAIYQLAQMYDAGEGVTADPSEAVRWLTRAASGGYMPAVVSLGIHYENGYGVDKDPSHALALYNQAVEAHDLGGMSILGVCYLEGGLVQQDIGQGVKILTTASQLDFSPATTRLAQLYSDGKIVPIDAQKAHDYLDTAVKQDSVIAMVMWGDLLDAGKVFPKDASQAFGWYLRAANHGDAEAMAKVGDRYRSGEGTQRDLKNAFAWYRKAADRGHAAAAYDVGVALLKGDGLARDPQQALVWLQRAEQWGYGSSGPAIQIARRDILALSIPQDRIAEYRSSLLSQNSQQLATARRKLWKLSSSSPGRNELADKVRDLSHDKSDIEALTDEQIASRLASADLKAADEQRRSAEQAEAERQAEAVRMKQIEDVPNGEVLVALLKDYADNWSKLIGTKQQLEHLLAASKVAGAGGDVDRAAMLHLQSVDAFNRIQDISVYMGAVEKRMSYFDKVSIKRVLDIWASYPGMTVVRKNMNYP